MDEIFPDLQDIFDCEMPDFTLELERVPYENPQQVQTDQKKGRFAELSEKDLNSLIENRLSAKTKKATNWAISTFKTWCREKKIQTPLEKMTIGQLDLNLRRFYTEARTKTGEDYRKSTLLGLRHGLERYLNQPPLNRGLKISQDPRFQKSNQMLDAQIVSLKKKNKQSTTHKPPIEEEDLVKLKASPVISLATPLSLLWNVWFHVVLYFCRRGREGQRELSVTSFKSEKDPSGCNFFTLSHDEVSKNHPGGVKDYESFEKDARMYETDHQHDGFKALKFYLSKVNPNCSSFFQYPRRNWSANDDIWFEARPIGQNKLGNMMKDISKAAGLSKTYTNHSVRATSITVWSNNGVPNRHIMAISGHRSEQSLVHYDSRPSTSQLYNCSAVLSKAMEKPKEEAVQSTLIKSSPIISPMGVQSLSSLGQYGFFNSCTIQNLQIFVGHANKTQL